MCSCVGVPIHLSQICLCVTGYVRDILHRVCSEQSSYITCCNWQASLLSPDPAKNNSCSTRLFSQGTHRLPGFESVLSVLGHSLKRGGHCRFHFTYGTEICILGGRNMQQVWDDKHNNRSQLQTGEDAQQQLGAQYFLPFKNSYHKCP